MLVEAVSVAIAAVALAGSDRRHAMVAGTSDAAVDVEKTIGKIEEAIVIGEMVT